MVIISADNLIIDILIKSNILDMITLGKLVLAFARGMHFEGLLSVHV